MEPRYCYFSSGKDGLVGLGATRLERFEPGGVGAGHIVMGDPEGTEFCLD